MTLIDLQGKTLYLGNDVIKKAYLGNTRLYGGYVFDNHTILTPEMVSGTSGGNNQRYIGAATHLIIDDSFPTDNLRSLFRDNQTLKSLVILTDKFTDMNNMFRNTQVTTLDLSSFNTSSVTRMDSMFRESLVTTLDLSSFNTSVVTNMGNMFYNSQATSLDVSSFDTSNVTNMSNMFRNTQVTTLDLSSFDTSNVTNMNNMFRESQATTGYARTQADADKFNASSGKPAGLNFVVKDV